MTNDLHEKLKLRRHKPNFKPPEDNIIFSINGKNIGCIQSFVCFQGLPKQGKSLFITSAIASAYTSWEIFGMKINFPGDRKRLCYIDTESSDYDFYRVLDRIRQQIITDDLPLNFDSYLMREDSPRDIQDMIDIYLEQNNDCSVLVIDGILDLISDFNNVEQSFYLIQWLKKITKIHNILVLCVLHLGKKDQNSIGHIGSYLDRKAQSVLKIEKNKDQNTIDLYPTFLRSSDEFNPISIQYQGGIWYQVNSEPVNKNDYLFGLEKKTLQSRLLIEPVKYNELINHFSEFTGKSVSTAKKIIKEWIQRGEIIKIDDHYKLK